jgi:hypothetical protein
MVVLGALAATFRALLTLLPIRYALGSGAGAERATASPSGGSSQEAPGTVPVLTHGVEAPADRAAHPAIVFLLVLIAGFTFVFLDFGLGLAVTALFGLA